MNGGGGVGRFLSGLRRGVKLAGGVWSFSKFSVNPGGVVEIPNQGVVHLSVNLKISNFKMNISIKISVI